MSSAVSGHVNVRNAYDIIVLGAGAAGMAAACTAAAHHRRVLVIEASDRVGGTTAISGGMVWVPANHKMLAAGFADSPELAREYLGNLVRSADSDSRLNAFLQRGDEAIRFLEVHTELRLRPVQRYPDYYPEFPGATSGGRVLEPVPYDGRLLGSDFALLRDPLPEFLLWGGMMVSREDMPVLRRATQSPAALWHAFKLLSRYAWQRRSAHRGTTLFLGNALAARLLRSLRNLGVELLLSSQVTRLAQDASGGVTGVVLNSGGTDKTLSARAGVVLATGGVSHHEEVRRRYVPAAAGDLSAAVDANAVLGGVQLASASQATLSPPSSSVEDALAFWVPASAGMRKDGTQAVFPHTVTDRAKPGLIAVNGQGQRFVNEAISYHEFVRAQLREPSRNIPAWLVCDKAFLWKYGLGRIRPFALSVAHELGSGYLRQGESLAALAAAIGVPSAALENTVTRFNADAAKGIDTAFGRGADIYQRHLGDAQQHPNPCVAPVAVPPFYAVAVYPADLGMAGGVITDEHARALRADGSIIDGLYACGNDMHSIMNGAYPGPGITLGPAIVFGYLAGLHASARGDRTAHHSSSQR